jgi:hypothetical protein
MANKYNVGDVVRVAVEFRDAVTGNLVNPAHVRRRETWSIPRRCG